MARSKSKYYIDPKEFRQELIDFFKLRETNPEAQWTDSLCRKFMKIIEGLSHHKSYCGYTYIDEMKDEALLCIMKYGHNFDPYRLDPDGRPYNPFSYYNRIASNAFVLIINKEAKQQKIKREYVLKNYTLNDDLFLDGSDGHAHAVEILAKMYDEKAKKDAS